MSKEKKLRLLIVSVFALLLSGCGTTQKKLYLENGLSELPQHSFVVGEMDFGKYPRQFGLDIEATYRYALKEELAKSALFADPNLKSEALRLDTFLIEYDPGEFAERWLIGFGAGAAYIELFVNVINEKTEERIGAVHILERN